MRAHTGEYAVAFRNEISSRTVEDLRYCFLYCSKALAYSIYPLICLRSLKIHTPNSIKGRTAFQAVVRGQQKLDVLELEGILRMRKRDHVLSSPQSINGYSHE